MGRYRMTRLRRALLSVALMLGLVGAVGVAGPAAAAETDIKARLEAVPGLTVLSEPTRLIDGNQISVEQRYFTPSRPSPTNWERQLTIWQAATDHHRIVRALKAIYAQQWVSTGASKGGMTSVYHRRFYPDDVAGT